MVVNWTVLFFIISIKNIASQEPNVCKEIVDYFHLNNNSNCWYNPDVVLDFIEIAERRGYPVEVHNTTTEDGYIVTIYRMPRPNAKVVILEPAMTVTASSFIKTGNASLGLNLYDSGYDVWFTNFRGTYYSRNHTSLSEYDPRFWDFSFHELGVYDFPAHFEYIKNITKKKAIVCTYSMAGTAGFIYNAVRPEHANEHVDLYIHIGPTVFSANVVQYYNSDLLRTLIVDDFHKYTSFNSFEEAREKLRAGCATTPMGMLTCVYNTVKVAGGSPSNLNPAYVPLMFYDNPTRVSHKHLLHYMQIGQADRFQCYDYGSVGNLMRYNSLSPPEYDLGKITIPIIIVHGASDASCTVENVEKLLSALPKEAKKYNGGKYLVENYNHIDLFFAKDCYEKVVRPVINFINTLST